MLATTTHSGKLLLIKMKVNILLGICEPIKRLEYEVIPKEIDNDARDTIAQLTRKTRLGARGYGAIGSHARLRI